MGKMKAQLMQMEEDASHMYAEERAQKWSHDELYIWARIQWEEGNDNIDEQFLAITKPEGSA